MPIPPSPSSPASRATWNMLPRSGSASTTAPRSRCRTWKSEYDVAGAARFVVAVCLLDTGHREPRDARGGGDHPDLRGAGACRCVAWRWFYRDAAQRRRAGLARSAACAWHYAARRPCVTDSQSVDRLEWLADDATPGGEI